MDTDISKTTYTDMENKVDDYEVASMQTEGISEQDETEYSWYNWPKWYGYYNQIPELKKAIDTYAIWVLGKGYNTDIRTKVILDHITGWGEDTFLSILWNMLVVKKINGDSFAEIILDEDSGMLINLKSLDPQSMKVIVDRRGRIKRYEQTNKIGVAGKEKRKFKPEEILHFCNDRVADNIHGTPVPECVQWVIDARNEAMTDWKRISHRSTIRVLYIDVEDTGKLNDIKKQYAEAINKGEVLVLPGTAKDAGFQDLTLPPAEQFLAWITYLENFFYQAVGVPKAISGGIQENTEASAKIGMAVFDPIYLREITDIEADLWNQLGIKISFQEQKSIMSGLAQSETKNTGQTGFQQSEVVPTKNE